MASGEIAAKYSVFILLALVIQSSGFSIKNDTVLFKSEFNSSNITVFLERLKRQTQYGNGCITPRQPKFGTYTFLHNSYSPGQLSPMHTLLKYSCNNGYTIKGSAYVNCLENGTWTSNTKCLKMCPALKSLTLDLICTVGSNKLDCNNYMKSGTKVTYQCKLWHHTSSSFSKAIVCKNGMWSIPLPHCETDCGREVSVGMSLSLNGTKVITGQFPWHAGIYSVVESQDPSQICGGTIVRVNIVISAAHCFWNERTGKLYPSSLYSVAVGKLYIGYNDSADSGHYVQRSDVKDIVVPRLYGGIAQNQQHDIAIVVVEDPFTFSDYVHPACLDLLNTILDDTQTERGNIGRVAGWGVTENDRSSNMLLTVKLPIVDYETCKRNFPSSFHRYLTWDKLCAGYQNGTSLCRGDSGSGLVFDNKIGSTSIWYLRAIVSVGVPATDTTDKCSNDTYSGFTHVWKHRRWISDVIEQSSKLSAASLTETISMTTPSNNPTNIINSCILPNYPANGNYANPQYPSLKPGDPAPEYTILMYNCDKDHSIVGSATVHCQKGLWNFKTECAKTCEARISHTVKFSCVKAGTQVACDQRVETGTVATATCAQGHFTTTPLHKMKLTCNRGIWDNPIPPCVPECGEEKGEADRLITGRRKVKRGEAPWHVGIYSTLYNDKKSQLCGGTILTVKVVISVASCFWSAEVEKLYDPTFYSVAVGKLFREFENEENKKYQYVQFSNVLEILVPTAYVDNKQHYQSDISLLIIEKPFTFSESVHPICIDLNDNQFDRLQITRGNFGKGAGWGVTSEGGDVSPVLKVQEIPVVDFADCYNQLPATFRRYLTADKFCAGYLNETNMCTGDGGGGLVFPRTEGSVVRWYLRGLVSVGVPSETSDTCRKDTYTGFTHVFMHRDWINEILDEYK